MNTPEGWKTNTGHGHVFPRADGVMARCGGPAICKVCALDLARKNSALASARTPPEQPAAQGELTDWPKPALLVDCAQGFVEGWTRSQVKAVIAADRTARKRPEAEVAEIMEAVKLALSNKLSIHEVERLVRGDKA